MNDLAKRASERILGSIARCPLDCFRASQATRPPTAGSEIRFRQATSAPTRILSPIKQLPALPDKETRKDYSRVYQAREDVIPVAAGGKTGLVKLSCSRKPSESCCQYPQTPTEKQGFGFHTKNPPARNRRCFWIASPA